MVQFTLNLAVDSDEGDVLYNTLITEIRNRTARGDSIDGVPILPPQVAAGGQLEFFDVNLSYTDRGTTHTVQARFRTDNLYLVGYRSANSNTWYELGHTDGGDRTLINEPNTQTVILRFGENYNGLAAAADLNLEGVPLSSSRIGVAITTLAGSETNQRPRARAILTLAFAIAEAARYQLISDFVVRSWWTESTPGPPLVSLMRSWARLSAEIQRTRNERHTFDFVEGSTGIRDFDSAIAVLGIMLLASRVSTPKRSTYDMAGALNSTYAQGQPLLEIFHVLINSIDGEKTGDLYGTITATDSVGTSRIWGHVKEEHVHIRPGSNILLEGPSRHLSAADEFYIQLDLYDHDDDPSPDDPIAQGAIAFNPLDYFTQYDVVENRTVTGKYGSVTVGYVAITDGLYARITVNLVNGDGESPADVYGDITTNNGHGQSELFGKAESEHISVSPQDKIPLSRSVVAVPTTGTLRVDAHLWDHDKVTPDDEIAAGFVEFKPDYRTCQDKSITGKYGEIKVRVEWM
ncbi:hypothetical protein PG997_015268 [Apiospora hydei]|uniref:DUF6598 domain-containing protein n=1 Tax=Apiospora hydei TaxID=1337664 RepID=A0ABR1UQ53_9PEZI